MKGSSYQIFFAALGLISLTIILISAILTADVNIIPMPYPESATGERVPVYDAVQYQTQSGVEKESSEGRAIFVKRPYGYIQSSQNGQANLSIIKTVIDRHSRDKAVIRGEIKNLDEKTIDLVIITFNLYNADGAQIGNAYASVDYLGPKTTWKFETEPIEKTDFQFERYASIYTGVFN
ncbi:MAG TPA: FxLYD domain-containing protein [Methanospirillum sp.]|nr:FxLYD domain-containing protein [Methanospirillum sp.]